jgi:hypothetical protein
MDKKTAHHIINFLRKATISWEGRKHALKRARKKVLEVDNITGKKKWKLYWQCKKCNCWKRLENEVEVDHIIEVGSFNGDWNDLIPRMFDLQNQQVLCIKCHQIKTSNFNASLRYIRKERPDNG